MDVRLSPEQRALRDSVAQVVDRLGARAVGQLADDERSTKLRAAVAASGWLELREPTAEGRALASGVEVAVVAEELGRGLVDAPFLGPTLAAELRRRAGAPAPVVAETVVLTAGLDALARAAEGAPVGGVAVDAHDAGWGLLVVTGPAAEGLHLARVPLQPIDERVDLTRPSAQPDPGIRPVPVEGATRPLDATELTGWTALGLAVACADLVGAMRGALDLSAEYARSRRQYGAPIGSFQAVQHLLADALVALEGSRSVALHAAWAVDALPADDALAAASVAKAYCARSALAVCETAIQVHGGIGNTWECLAHVFLRRSLLSGEVLGGVGPSLNRVLDHHGIGALDGLR